MINKDYKYNTEWSCINDIDFPPNTLYLYSRDPEDRSTYGEGNLKDIKNINLIQISLTSNDELEVIGLSRKIALNNSDLVKKFVEEYSPKNIFIEATGMSCRLLAPLLQCVLLNNYQAYVIYIEPDQYVLPEFEKIGVHKDLSEECDGIKPLPGFASVIPFQQEPIFVALLGFEGGRFSYVTTAKQPSSDHIYPIIGVPGYLARYPFEAFWGNRHVLKSLNCCYNVEYAEANSIVDCYMMLQKISMKKRDANMIIAPIGTKPHAIGAILYAIKNKPKVELLYDNPKRSIKRTTGIGKIIVCDITKLFDEE